MDKRGRMNAISAPPLDLMTPWLARECTELLPPEMVGTHSLIPGTRSMWARSTCNLYLVHAYPHSRDHDGLCVD